MGEKDYYHHGALREALIVEAFKVLESDGLDGISLRGLAIATGVSKTAPYRHFSDKRDLLITLAAEGFRRFADALEGAVAALPHLEAADSLAGIRSLHRAYIDFAQSQPALYRLMFSQLGYSLHSEACRVNSMRAFGILTRSIEEAQRAGWRSRQDTRALVLSVWAGVHGWAGLLIDGLVPEGFIGPQEDLFAFSQGLLD
jgi:AcrR family transcriptional regulator